MLDDDRSDRIKSSKGNKNRLKVRKTNLTKVMKTNLTKVMKKNHPKVIKKNSLIFKGNKSSKGNEKYPPTVMKRSSKGK